MNTAQFEIAPLPMKRHAWKVMISPTQIIDRVANYFHVRAVQIVGHRRVRHVARARHAAMFLIRERLDLSLAGIGLCFSNRDHSTVFHGIAKTREEMLLDVDFRDQMKDLSKYLEEVGEIALVDV